MAELPNRLVIEIADTNKFDELGNPVIDFESKDYAECVIEELEKIKAKIVELEKKIGQGIFTVELASEIVNDHISELKGE